jgi:hypothetical protein
VSADETDKDARQSSDAILFDSESPSTSRLASLREKSEEWARRRKAQGQLCQSQASEEFTYRVAIDPYHSTLRFHALLHSPRKQLVKHTRPTHPDSNVLVRFQLEPPLAARLELDKGLLKRGQRRLDRHGLVLPLASGSVRLRSVNFRVRVSTQRRAA